LFLFQNLDIIDAYWLAKKKSAFVLYYSLSRAAIRVVAVIITAYFTHNVLTIIYVLIILEFAKFLFILFYLLNKNLLSLKIDWISLKEQLIYIVPLGIASILLEFNRDISKVIISANLGASVLALYAVASQNLPIVTVVRSSVADVIFPDMTEKISKKPLEALKLWSRSNIIYLFLMSPLFFIMFIYADVLIKVLFTSDYLEAVPIFQVYLIFFLKQCFEMGIPIRAMNKNKYFLIGYIFTSALNFGLLYVLFGIFGLLGPAIAYVVSEVVLSFYFANRILKIYEIKIRDLFFWKKVSIILGIGLGLTPILVIGKFLPITPIIGAVILTTTYLILYLIILRFYNLDEVNLIMGKVFKKFRLSW
jgi:O-antigen/teichoic acid export membrane protein